MITSILSHVVVYVDAVVLRRSLAGNMIEDFAQFWLTGPGRVDCSDVCRGKRCEHALGGAAVMAFSSLDLVSFNVLMLSPYSQAEDAHICLGPLFGRIPIHAAAEDLVRALEHPAMVRFAWLYLRCAVEFLNSVRVICGLVVT